MKKSILWIIMLLSTFTLQAQTDSMQRLNIKSPEVAAFTKVGEVPVSLYTGVPRISIPIYEVKCGELKLPITLDYQATAIQVNQESTWVGLNWLLNAGGVVTTQTTKPNSTMKKEEWDFLYNKLNLRSVGNDDFGRYYKMDGNHEMGWRGSYGYNRFQCITWPSSADVSYNMYTHLLANYEGQAQSYSANFMGHSFNFIYHPLQEKFIVTGKDQNFQIEGSPTNVSKITDANGIQYTFGIVEVNAPEAYTTAPYATRSVTFYLTQIKHPNGKTINLRYKQYDSIRLLPEILETWHYGLTDEVNYRIDKRPSDLVKINNYYLSEIVTDEATVRFNAGTRIDLKGGRKLESIEVLNNTGKLIKRFRLAYDYITGNSNGGNRLYEYYNQYNQLSTYRSFYTSDEISTRLNLISLNEETTDNNNQLKVLPSYKFSYNSGLPGKASSARDYWGNYNGRSNTTLLVDRSKSGESGYNNFPYIPTASMSYADRRCNPNTISAGMLNRITYPTGGESSFTYEPHSFTNYTYYNVNQSATTPGLSVYAMTTNTNSTIPAVNTEPKDFTTGVNMEVEMTIVHFCPTSLSWRDMLGSPAQLFIYETVITPSGPSIHFYPIKTWALTPSDTLKAVNGQIKRVERFLLPAGKYQLRPSISSPQITPYNGFPGCKRVEMTIKNTNNVISDGGGVRIKQILQTDAKGNAMTTQYDYSQETGATSGLLMYPLRFAREKMQVYQAAAGPDYDTPAGPQQTNPPAAILKYYWMVHSENMAPTKGVLVGYSRVTVNRSNGKTISDFWNNNSKYSSFDFNPPLDDPRNGNLLREVIYESSGKMKRETVNTYSTLKKEHHYINAIVEDIHYGAEGCDRSGLTNRYAQSCGGGRMLFCVYPSSKFWIECTGRIVKEYCDEGTMTKEYKYTYNPWNLQLSTFQTIHNSSFSETIHTLYPQNYYGSSYTNTLIGKHILNTPTEMVKVINRSGSSSVVGGELNSYNDNGQLSAHYKLKLAAPLNLANFKFSNKDKGVLGTDTLNLKSYSPSSDYAIDTSCNYTTNGNLANVTEKQILTTVYLWSYNKQHVIAEISNTTYAKVKEALGYTLDTQIATLEAQSAPDVTEIRKKLNTYFKASSALVTTYTYSPLVGVTTKTDPNGNVTNYNYDAFGRLQSVTDNGKKTVRSYEYNYKN